MTTISPHLDFILSMTKAQSIITRKFDASLNGLSLSDFMILFTLSHAKDGKMRRIDLAEAIGLTASGITRLLAPMEKVGLVKRELNAHDARVSFVVIANGGKAKLKDEIQYADLLAKKLLTSANEKGIESAMSVVKGLGGKF